MPYDLQVQIERNAQAHWVEQARWCRRIVHVDRKLPIVKQLTLQTFAILFCVARGTNSVVG